jgi:hypothetical protein
MLIIARICAQGENACIGIETFFQKVKPLLPMNPTLLKCVCYESFLC